MVAWATIDNFGLVNDLMHILTKYRVGVRNNLIGFKVAAQAQAVAVETLAAQIDGQADLLVDKFNKIQAVATNPAARDELDDGLVRAGYTRAELQPNVVAFRDSGNALKAAPKATYAECIAAIDTFLATIPPRRSFWPE